MNGEDLIEIMSHFNGLNYSYRASLDARTSESRQTSSRAFYEHRDWLQQHGIKVRLSSQRVWVMDAEGSI